MADQTPPEVKAYESSLTACFGGDNASYWRCRAEMAERHARKAYAAKAAAEQREMQTRQELVRANDRYARLERQTNEKHGAERTALLKHYAGVRA